MTCSLKILIGASLMSISIQYQQIAGWQTTSQIEDNATSQQIIREMEQVQKMHPNARIRSIDSSGRLIDKL